MNNAQKIINITEDARDHLLSLNKLKLNNIYLRISVKQGGCSGMSYTMNFDQQNNISPYDQIINYESFQVVCDSKSLLYLYGMSLDYADELVGGGFKFINPNATQTCGCGKSFYA
uniref:Core domain-containing protein n=1 Tax=Riquetophycus sp. TaxID=1897556 RepID=A0A1C9C840_9FLOR|nr:hypothetical protein Riqu_071 [Riquetophycus sp.]